MISCKSIKILLKKNRSILKNVDLINNQRFINEKTAVLPSGKYDIEMGDRLNIFSTGHYLKFKNINTQIIIEFEIHDGGIDKDNKCINLENAKVKHKKWNNDSYYSDFIQYFKILEKKEIIIEFSDADESNKLVILKKINEMGALDVIEKMEEINKSKSMLINRLQSDCKEIFDELLYEMIKIEDLKNSRILGEILEHKGGTIVANGINYLIQLNKEIGFKKTNDLEILRK